jgi:hypothetical protein
MNYSLGNMLGGGNGGLNADKLSLNLQFATDKTLTARKGPTPTFTRASTATFVGSDGLIQSTAINEPRFDHDPVTLASKGLLIEESRTNLISRSESIANSAWDGFASATATDNVTTSPSGVATSASQLTAIAAASSGARARVRITSLLSGSSQRTASAFIKAGTHDFGFVALAFNKVGIGTVRSSVIRLKFSDGSFVQTGIIEGFSASVTPFQNDWYRITISAVSNASLSVEDQVVISLGLSFNKEGDTGEFVGTETIFAWGAQLEAGSFPTSYIPTTTASVVRSADVCSITGSDFTGMYNASEGTMLVNAFTPANGDRTIFAVDDNTANEMIRLRTEGTNPFFKVTDGGSELVAIDSGTVAANTTFKLAGAYKLNDFASSINGGAAVTDTSGTIPTVDRIRIGAGQSGNTMCGCISSLRYYKKRLSDLKLQTLTT